MRAQKQRIPQGFVTRFKIRSFPYLNSDRPEYPLPESHLFSITKIKKFKMGRAAFFRSSFGRYFTSLDALMAVWRYSIRNTRLQKLLEPSKNNDYVDDERFKEFIDVISSALHADDKHEDGQMLSQVFL